MNKEKKIYGVSIEKTNKYLDNMSNEQIIKEGEENGIIYSINGFISAVNNDWLNTEEYYYKLIK